MTSSNQLDAYAESVSGIPVAQAVLDSLTSQVAVIDRSGAIVAVNRAWNAFAHDNGAGDLIGTGVGANYLEVLRTSIEHGSEDAQTVLTGILAVMNGAESEFTLEYSCAAPDTPRWFSMHATPLDGSGVVVSHTNVTERKLAEMALEAALEREATARLRTEAAERVLMAIVERVPVGIILVNPAGDILLMNSAGRQMVGMPSGDRIPSARNIGDWRLLAPDTVDPISAAEQPLARALRGEHVTDVEFLVSLLDGSGSIRVRESAVPLLEPDGRVGGAVAVFGDVTAEREIEDQREAFISNAAHDLKGPLTTIKGFAQLLRRQVERDGQLSGPRTTETLNQIDRTATRLAAQIAELQDIASIRTGKAIRLTLTETHVCALVLRVVQQYQETVEDRQFVPELPGTEITARWDASRMERVLQNLLTNAVKYSAADTRITVRVRREGDTVVLAVGDQGIGIPERDLPHIFERYFRAGNVTERVGGTGIGLAGVQQIVALHGGTVNVQSHEGEGTTFTIRVPLVAPDQPAAD